MSKKLDLIFENELGRSVTLSLDNPVYPADPTAINAAMDVVIAQNAFTSLGGNLIIKKGARIVDRTVEDIEL
ncbi:DUF2922 domain-containing protein [Bacillus solitudinis]|uniref:DUF2922 domain-containing protein n=1 Tax=Bacillus solitudinis TaxID=2014074 RepID=UPI000C236D72|nr:DUF2922 domain-containing protein [Bacillus solitudinis]